MSNAKSNSLSGNRGLAAPQMSVADTIRSATSSFGSRRLRTLLSALGIAIGIASLVAVTGLAASNRAHLLGGLDNLGTNLLTATGGRSFGGEQTKLAETSAAQLQRLGGVESAATTREVATKVRRTPETSRGDAPGVAAAATQTNLLDVISGELETGQFLNASTAAYDNVVLGSLAADRLGVQRTGIRIDVDGRWMTVVGILKPVVLAPEIDSKALIGEAAASRYFDSQEVFGERTRPEVDIVYVRADPASLDDVRAVIASTLKPLDAREVTVARPSEVLRATALADEASQTLFLSLGFVALVVGGIGVANVMVIAVIERRNEIGLRRSLGATRRHIRRQFIIEAIMLSALGGVIGLALGTITTAAWATKQAWPVQLPPQAIAIGLVAALVVGALAGHYPATKAARLSPVDALRT